MDRTLIRQYLLVTALLTLFGAALWVLIRNPPLVAGPEDSAWLVWPMLWLVGLTGVVWLLMAIARNYAVIRGAAELHYFRTYQTQAPAEWVERPARAFMNLLELPLLFYVLCLLLMQTHLLDSVQLTLAWLFVALRYAHSAVHIGINYVPIRFAFYAMGFVTLAAMWIRFALHFSEHL